MLNKLKIMSLKWKYNFRKVSLEQLNKIDKSVLTKGYHANLTQENLIQFVFKMTDGTILIVYA